MDKCFICLCEKTNKIIELECGHCLHSTCILNNIYTNLATMLKNKSNNDKMNELNKMDGRKLASEIFCSRQPVKWEEKWNQIVSENPDYFNKQGIK